MKLSDTSTRTELCPTSCLGFETRGDKISFSIYYSMHPASGTGLAYGITSQKALRQLKNDIEAILESCGKENEI